MQFKESADFSFPYQCLDLSAQHAFLVRAMGNIELISDDYFINY